MIAFIDDKPVGCVIALKYDNHTGFIGYLAVLRQYREHRIGYILMAKAKAVLHQQGA